MPRLLISPQLAPGLFCPPMKENQFFDDWQKARHYIAWARRQGFSSETIQEIPLMDQLKLSDQEREILVNVERRTTVNNE